MPTSDIEQLVRHLAAAGHPVQLRILRELSSQERRPAELADVLSTSADAVRRHLWVLREDGLLDREPGGFIG